MGFVAFRKDQYHYKRGSHSHFFFFLPCSGICPLRPSKAVVESCSNAAMTALRTRMRSRLFLADSLRGVRPVCESRRRQSSKLASSSLSLLTYSTSFFVMRRP